MINETVFLAGCPVIKPEGIYVNGRRVIATDPALTGLGDRYDDEKIFYVVTLGSAVAGAIAGAKIFKKHPVIAGAAGLPVGAAAGMVLLQLVASVTR